MAFVLDLILVVIFAAFVFEAVKKGFVLSFLELVAVILAFVMAYTFSPTVAQMAYDGFVKESVIETIETQIDENVSLSETSAKAQLIIESIPDYVVSFADTMGISVEDIKNDVAETNITSENVATELVEKIAQPIIIGVLTALSFTVLAIVLLFVLKLVAKLISRIFRLPIIKTINKTLGGVLGACKGLAVIIFICTILTVFFSSGDSELATAVNESRIINAIDGINPFIKSLKDII